MNAHTRFALPVNTPGNLKYLHDQAQQAEQQRTAKTKNDQPQSTTAARRDSATDKLAQKMKGLFLGRKNEQPTLTEEELDERKRSTMRQLVGSHDFVQMGRR